MTLNFEQVDKTRVAVYKKGFEPSDVVFWLSRPPYERIKTLELICQEYNSWKYGTQSGFQRVYSVVKRKKRQISGDRRLRSRVSRVSAIH